MGKGCCVDSMGKRGVDGMNTVGDDSISAVKSVGGISHDGGVGSEGLALGGGPVLSLVGLAHGLVADLTVSVSVDWLVGAIVHGGNSGGDGGGQNRGMDSGVMSDGVNSGVVDHWGSVDGVMGNWVDRSGVVGNRVDG